MLFKASSCSHEMHLHLPRIVRENRLIVWLKLTDGDQKFSVNRRLHCLIRKMTEGGIT